MPTTYIEYSGRGGGDSRGPLLYEALVALVHTHVHMQGTYHGDEDREGPSQLGKEPVLRLDVLRFVQDWVVHYELLPRFGSLAPADVGLDLLLKLWPGTLLRRGRGRGRGGVARGGILVFEN